MGAALSFYHVAPRDGTQVGRLAGWQVGSEHLLAPGTLCPAQLSRSHRPLTAWLDLAPCFLPPSVPTTFLPWAPALSAIRRLSSLLFWRLCSASPCMWWVPSEQTRRQSCVVECHVSCRYSPDFFPFPFLFVC